MNSDTKKNVIKFGQWVSPILVYDDIAEWNIAAISSISALPWSHDGEYPMTVLSTISAPLWGHDGEFPWQYSQQSVLFSDVMMVESSGNILDC